MKKIPLLIGGATTQPRAHRGEDRAALRRPGGLRARRLAQRGRVLRPAVSDERAARYIAELNADYAKVREQHANKKATPLVTLAAGARQQDADRLGRPTRRRSRSSSAGACSATTTWPSWPRASTGRPFFQTWDLAGPFPDILRDEVVGARGAARVQRRQAAAAAADRRPLAAGQRRDRRCCRPTRWTTTPSRSTPTRSRSEVALRWHAAAPADRAPGGRRREAAQPLPGRLHRAQGRASPTTSACSP